MTNVEKLQALGADIVGGDLIWKHKVLGSFRDGELQLTKDGEDALQIEEAVIVTKPAKAKKPKAEPTAPAEAPAPAGEEGIGDLEIDPE